MRRGEIAALRWDDIDFANQRAYICQTRSPIGTDMVITTPKSGNGRLIDLDTETTRRFTRPPPSLQFWPLARGRVEAPRLSRRSA